MSIGNSAKNIAGFNSLYNAKIGESFVGILDLYPNAKVAYSVRKLKSSYTGAAIRVRRDIDNVEQDIGFTPAGNLDETALTSFVGSSNGFITTWYDQSGQNNNATNPTAIRQPKIVQTGVIIKVNTKPAIEFPQTNLHWLNLATTITPAADNFQFFVADRNHLNKIFTALSGNGFNGIYTNNVEFIIAKEFYVGSSNTITGQMLWLTTQEAADYDLFINNVNRPIVLNYTYNATYSYISNYFFEGQSGIFQEIIMWNFNRTSDKAGITTNVNTYYGIF
jgi:hypothetical protein